MGCLRLELLDRIVIRLIPSRAVFTQISNEEQHESWRDARDLPSRTRGSVVDASGFENSRGVAVGGCVGATGHFLRPRRPVRAGCAA